MLRVHVYRGLLCCTWKKKNSTPHNAKHSDIHPIQFLYLKIVFAHISIHAYYSRFLVRIYQKISLERSFNQNKRKNYMKMIVCLMHPKYFSWVKYSDIFYIIQIYMRTHSGRGWNYKERSAYKIQFSLFLKFYFINETRMRFENAPKRRFTNCVLRNTTCAFFVYQNDSLPKHFNGISNLWWFLVKKILIMLIIRESRSPTVRTQHRSREMRKF